MLQELLGSVLVLTDTMGGGAWPFLVGGVKTSKNKTTLLDRHVHCFSLGTMQVQVPSMLGIFGE